MPMTNDQYEAFRAECRREGLSVDPAIAETCFSYRDVFDPYDILPDECRSGTIGREEFARNPGGDWLCFEDLPDTTQKALWQRDGAKLQFPYGLNPGDDLINKPAAMPIGDWEEDFDAGAKALPLPTGDDEENA